jgi:hypothetical protein
VRQSGNKQIIAVMVREQTGTGGRGREEQMVEERGGKERGRKRQRNLLCRWFTSIILATQGAEIRGIRVQRQPR